MVSIDLSVLPRFISLLEDLPNIKSLKQKVALLETQLQEKQQLIETLQSRPTVIQPEIPPILSPSLDTPIIEALQQRLTDALQQIDHLKAQNKALKSQIESMSQRSWLIPLSLRSEDYISTAKTASEKRLECLVCHGVRYKQLWSKFIRYLTASEIYSLSGLSDFWRVNISMDRYTLEYLAFTRPQITLTPVIDDTPVAVDESGRELLEK